MRIFIWVFVSLVLLLAACRKDSFNSSPEAKMIITADTVKFDTVFVSAGSTYRYFRIINDNDQKLRISSLKLMGGVNSAYKINVDGVMGTDFNNLDLAANDSLYVFVQVNIDPNAANQPFVVRDSIQVRYNGRERWVQLEAFGQNAHFFRDRIIGSNETWNNDKPYVILGSITINENQVLTINKGCRIYFHANAPMIVDGSLQVNGLKDSADRVWFNGDRLDEPYRDFPASWPGIYFRATAKDNVLGYAVIKNAYQALAVEDPSPNANPKLTLNETIIENAYDAGIISANSSIRARNCLVANCGKNISLLRGGDYQFTHCTIAGYSNRFLTHRDPVLLLTNFGTVNNTVVSANLNALFRNCIFWGETGFVNDEVVVLKNGNTLFSVNFDQGLWRVQTPPANSVITQVINNQDPAFDSVDTRNNYYNFRLKTGSPAKNKGVNTGIATDLDGRSRAVGLPDLGAYEKQ